jgi:ATP synthase protein I
MADHRDDSLEERMDQLGAKLASSKKPDAKETEKESGRNAGYSQAIKLSSEFIAAILVGALIGYVIDLAAPTKPFGLIIFLILGFCAGILNVLRTVGVVKDPHPVEKLRNMDETKKRK